MFLLNSRLGLFTAASLRWHPFSRTYGVILPSSLTIVLSLTLGFSPHLPVSVCGTGTYSLTSGFSRQCEISSFGSLSSPSQLSLFVRGFACVPSSLLGHALPAACSAYPSASPLRSNNFRWYWNLYQLSIAYDFRPRLRSRLTLSGRAFLRKPWIFGGRDSHPAFATHANILSPIQSSLAFARPSARIRCSSTNSFEFLSFGSKFQPRLSSAQSHSTSELLRTLSMNGCF